MMNKFNFKNVTPAVWARIVALILATVNQVAISIFNVTLLPFEDEEIYEGISTILTVVTAIIGTYKDTPLTVAAQEGNKVTKELKGDNK